MNKQRYRWEWWRREKLIKKRRSRDENEEEGEKKLLFWKIFEIAIEEGKKKINLKNEEAETRMMKKGKKTKKQRYRWEW